MPRSTKLLPGQEVTVKAFNAEVDRTRKQLSGGAGSTIDSGTTGGGATPMRELQPRWGRITDTGPDSSPDYYQWEEVYPDKDGNWTARTSDADTVLAAHDSVILTDVTGKEWLINPAVEVNGHDIPIGTVVRLIPSENFVEEEKGLRDDIDDYWMHRHWLFDWPGDQLRPFKLTADLIPTGGPDPDLTIAAEWLDDPGEEVTLYPVHRSGWPAGDEFLSLGVGRGEGSYFRGTYGWARFQPEATIIGLDAAGEPIWRPEWQIVTLYAEMNASLVVFAAAIDPQETGKAALFWHDKHDSDKPTIDSGYTVDLFNDLLAPLASGDIVKAWFSRHHYHFRPMGPPPPYGMSVYASATVGATVDATSVIVPFDTEIASFDIGLELNAASKGIKNISGVDLVVLVEWSVTAERSIGPAAPDIDSTLEVALFNNGVEVTGSLGEMTSSRRNAPGEGNFAVNNVSGHIIQQLDDTDILQVKVRKMNSTGGDDDWVTTAAACHMTVQTIPGVALNP